MQNQYAARLDTNPAALQQLLSKMRAEIKQLQQTRCPSSCPNAPETIKSFLTMDVQIICCCCNQFGHFAHLYKTNITPVKTNKYFPTPNRMLVVIRMKDPVI